MRFIGFVGALCVAVFMIWALPALWQRAMVHEIKDVDASPAPFVITGSVDTPHYDSDSIVAAMHPPIDVDTKKFAQIGADSAARQQQLIVRGAENQVPVN